jgi:intron-binding protein aquarius
VNLSALRPDVRAEWDELRQHDVLFLLAIRPPDAVTANYMAQAGRGAAGEAAGFMERAGLRYVRGCEVVEIRDEGEAAGSVGWAG